MKIDDRKRKWKRKMRFDMRMRMYRKNGIRSTHESQWEWRKNLFKSKNDKKACKGYESNSKFIRSKCLARSISAQWSVIFILEVGLNTTAFKSNFIIILVQNAEKEWNYILLGPHWMIFYFSDRIYYDCILF